MTERLTDLEGAILSLLIKCEGVTAYGIRTAFRRSPSEFWSGSAGAIYPAIARLEARGLVIAKAANQGKRKSKDLSLSTAGRSAVVAWAGQTDAACGAGFDPFRVRANVWQGLPRGQRDAVYRDLAKAIEARLAALPPTGMSVDDPAYTIEMAQQRARLDWLKAQSSS
tara:strand:- start:4344 stop:4847 length:504 start_codon:yes stop_codon:yes gene_type:complete